MTRTKTIKERPYSSCSNPSPCPPLRGIGADDLADIIERRLMKDGRISVGIPFIYSHEGVNCKLTRMAFSQSDGCWHIWVVMDRQTVEHIPEHQRSRRLLRVTTAYLAEREAALAKTA